MATNEKTSDEATARKLIESGVAKGIDLPGRRYRPNDPEKRNEWLPLPGSTKD